MEGHGTRHLRVGGVAIDAPVAEAFLAQPAALQACLQPARQLEERHDASAARWSRPAIARPGPSAATRPSTPITALLARGLRKALAEVAAAEAEPLGTRPPGPRCSHPPSAPRSSLRR